MTSLAITDHGVLFGAAQFARKAAARGIRPLIGCELYVAPRSRHDRTPKIDDDPYHLVVLAKDEEGYRNLSRLSSLAFLEGFYYKPRVDKELLAAHSKGLVALSACLGGEVPRRLLAQGIDAAAKAAGELSEIFGKDGFFLELQSNGIREQREVNRGVLEVAKRLGLRTAATNDVHYINREDARVHDVLLCIQTGATVDDPSRMRFETDAFYLRSGDEMAREFHDVPEALDSTLDIAAMCANPFKFGESHVPAYPVPEGYDEGSYLRKLAYEGAERRYGALTEEIRSRLDYELSVIGRMGYSGYFLIVWDFIKFAKDHGVYVGPGRGSAPGSMVAYSLGITDIDPLKYGLIFERFLNPDRVSMPDIDVDFCFERRGEVIEYVTRKYGADRVAQIITFGTMAARAAIRDVGRALGMPYGEVDRVAKLVPMDLGMTLERALSESQELAALVKADESARRLVETARAVEGMPRHSSVHAAGVVISKGPLVDYVPVAKTADDAVTTQFPMEDLEALGVLKMDFLGLRTLTVIGKTVEMVRDSRGVDIDVRAIPLDDPEVYAMLSRADSIGVFQFESRLFQGLLREVRPTRFEDLIALLALGRPGPMNQLPGFVKARRGEVEVNYPHPSLAPILEETYGIMLYQEQVMKVAEALAGFSLAEADLLRRAMGKKKPEVLAGMRDRFIKGAEQRGVPAETAREVFDLMEYFSGYGFNKSHSAAYALVSYQTAWLKAHYFPEFMAATLNSVIGSSGRVAVYVEECRAKGVRILPPDVNESAAGFTVAGNDIRFGLEAVKNVGSSAVQAIIDERARGGPYRSLSDFCQRVDLGLVNRKMLESLIRAGAFDFTGARRSQLVAVMDRAYEAGQSVQRQKAAGQVSLFEVLAGTPAAGLGAHGPAAAGAQALAGAEELDLPDVKEFDEEDLLRGEAELLGMYVSGHPLDRYRPWIRALADSTTAGLEEEPDGAILALAGMVRGVKRTATKSGTLMAFFTLEDVEGTCEVVVFPRVYERFRHIIEDGRPVLVVGRVDAREDGVKFICEAAGSIADGYLELVVDSAKVGRRELARLAKVLSEHRGYAPVVMTLEKGDETVKVRVAPEHWVDLGRPTAGALEELERAVLGVSVRLHTWDESSLA